MRTTLILPLLGLLATTALHANNIQVTNTTLVDNTGSTVKVQFDISWENSWRGGGVNNWDAAWVFVKYRQGQGAWQHVYVNPSGHTTPAGSLLEPGLVDPGAAHNATTNPVVGLFLRRDADGNGTFTATGVQLLWDYGVLGIAINDISQVQVFAVEMVYVNQGAFTAGSGGTEISAFILTTISTGTANTAPSGTGSLGGQAGGFPTGQTAPTSATWPNGFNAFYCMKYEVTQQGYVDFLNSLSYAQQITRTATAPNSAAGTGALSSTNADRNGIDINIPGVDPGTAAVYACNLNGNGVYGEATDGKDIACNFLSWGDLTAYLDWSGLRPMTELEFEKACRGPLFPLADEYPWGTTGVAASAFTLASPGATNEGIATNYSTTVGNAVYGSTNGTPSGPKRVGIFAANGSNSGRVTAGASYFGIMELGGNVYERAVTIGNPSGRVFTGTHGNGVLALDGDANVATWPVPSTADGAGVFGGSWLAVPRFMRVSNRELAAVAFGNRDNSRGGRGCRLKP
ncbi:MAG: SUMF1/EgtB/PvdO family nonheme iron enzyme [Flavobacteriales bacterium]